MQASNLKVEYATEDDLQDLVGMALEAQLESPYTDLPVDPELLYNSLLRLFKEGSNMACLKATQDGVWLGFLIYIISKDSLFLPGVLVQQELLYFVLPEHRGTKAAKMLKAYFEEIGRTNGADVLSMCTMANDSQDVVDRLYKRDGYTPVEHTYYKRIGV